MDVVQLLEHHRVVEDGLGMVAFLPDLIAAMSFVGLAKRLESIEQPAASFAGNLLQKAAGGEFLQVAHHGWEIRGGYDRMEMIFHDDPCVELQLLVFPAIVDGADQDVAARGGGEDRKPADDRRSNEVSSVGLVDAINASHGAEGIARQMRVLQALVACDGGSADLEEDRPGWEDGSGKQGATVRER
jgi:hypothetical protein